jgi:hypothetical protein
MSSHPNLKSAPPPFEAKFAKSGALREAIGETGRVHVDRWLPFLIVHRSERPEASLARRIARPIWSGRPLTTLPPCPRLKQSPPGWSTNRAAC